MMSQKRFKRSRKMEVVEKAIPKTDVWQELLEILRKNWVYLLIVGVVVVGLYTNSLQGGFVSDDYASITQNQRINDFWFMFNKGNSMDFGTYLIYKTFGNSSPTPYHVYNLICYLIVCFLVFVLLELVLENNLVSRLALALFAVHPIHVEAVSWISGRIYLVLATYTLLGLIAFILYVKHNQPKMLIITLTAFILGFLTDKPRPFALFLLVFLYLLYFGIKRVKFDWFKLFGVLTVVGTVFVIIAWPNIKNRIGIVNGGYNASESIFYNPFFQYPTGITKYLQLLWFPIDLTLYHTMYVLPSWLNWLVLLLFLGSTVYFYFKNRPYFWAMSFMVAAVLPSIMPIKVSWLVAERYMLLGSVGFCAMLALFVTDLSRISKLVPAALVGALLIFYSVRVVTRNIDWQTNHNLWVNTCLVSPNSHNAWNNIGDDYDKLKDYVNAVKGFSQSTLVKPNYADAYHNRANILYKIGRLDLARESYNIAINLSPSLVQSYISLTQIDMTEKKIDLAQEHATAAYKLDPTNPQTSYILGAVYIEAGKTAEAKNIMENILKQYPNFQLAREALLQISK